VSSSTSSSRGRLATLALAFVLALGLGVVAVAWPFWDGLVEVGRRELKHRPEALANPARLAEGVPLAVFLGDSTFLPGWAYPRVLAKGFGERAELRAFWWEGYEPFHHYLLAGRAIELRPDAVVIVAQTRVFWRHEPLWYADLPTLVPPRELPRAVLLPFHERGISVPRLVLASLLGSLRETSDAWIQAFVGARQRAEHVPGLRWLVPSQLAVRDSRRLVELRRQRFHRYAMPIFEGHPAVRALAATVEQAVRAGARTIVLVSPIPVERLTEEGLYDPEVFAKRVAVIQRAVEGEGGETLDLHALLRGEDFTDEFGHMSRSGARKVALVLEPWLRKALDLGRGRGPARYR
jgi:hypothetical protein